MSLDTYQNALEGNHKAHSPRTQYELEYFLAAVHDHSREIRGWKTNAATNALEVDLGLLSPENIPPVFLVAKKGKTATLRHILERLLIESQGGYPPSQSVAGEVWALIDQSAAIR